MTEVIVVRSLTLDLARGCVGGRAFSPCKRTYTACLLAAIIKLPLTSVTTPRSISSHNANRRQVTATSSVCFLLVIIWPPLPHFCYVMYTAMTKYNVNTIQSTYKTNNLFYFYQFYIHRNKTRFYFLGYYFQNVTLPCFHL